MSEKESEKYLNYAEMAIQDRDYEDAKKNILKSLNYKITEKAYKMLDLCNSKLKGQGKRSHKNSNAREPSIPNPEPQVITHENHRTKPIIYLMKKAKMKR